MNVQIRMQKVEELPTDLIRRIGDYEEILVMQIQLAKVISRIATDWEIKDYGHGEEIKHVDEYVYKYYCAGMDTDSRKWQLFLITDPNDFVDLCDYYKPIL